MTAEADGAARKARPGYDLNALATDEIPLFRVCGFSIRDEFGEI